MQLDFLNITGVGGRCEHRSATAQSEHHFLAPPLAVLKFLKSSTCLHERALFRNTRQTNVRLQSSPGVLKGHPDEQKATKEADPTGY